MEIRQNSKNAFLFSCHETVQFTSASLKAALCLLANQDGFFQK